MTEDKKYPKFVVGSFIINGNGELFLRSTPSQDNKFTCINEKVAWGETIEQTIKRSVKEKTNLEVYSFELIGLTDGLNITSSQSTELSNMIFADYKVVVNNTDDFRSNEPEREFKWLKPKDWLTLDKNLFGQYINEVIEKIVE